MKDHPTGNIEDKLESLQLPQVKMNGHKEQLRAALLSCGHGQTRATGGFITAAPKKYFEVITLKKKVLAVSISLLLLLLAGLSLHIMYSPPQAAAVLTLQVNPTLTLSLDRDYTIIALEGVNDDGEEITSLANLQGKKLGDALEEIIALLDEHGFLSPENKISMILHAIDDLDAAEISALLDLVQEAMIDSLSRLNIEAPVEYYVLSKELHDFFAGLGLSPMDYLDLLSSDLNEEEIMEIIMDLYDPGALPYAKFELEIESPGRQLSVEFKQEEDGSKGEVKIKQASQKDIKLEGSDALDYLLPILNRLNLNASMSRTQIVDRVLAAFRWTGDYDEFKIEIKFADGSSIEIKQSDDYDDDESSSSSSSSSSDDDSSSSSSSSDDDSSSSSSSSDDESSSSSSSD